MSVAAVTFLVLGAVMVERHALLDQERRARTESERAVRVRDDFLRMASHELRTPITPLKLQLEGVRRAAEGHDEKLRDRVERAIRQTDRLARLAEGLLDVSRLSSGRLELEIADVDLVEVVREVALQLADEASKYGSTMTVVEGGPASARGRWDRARTAQALSNVLSNALKYGRGQPVEITVAESESLFSVSIRDHGVGIAREGLERIFERFERVSPSRESAGLGLGLYVAREIVRVQGGAIRVESEVGRGSTFTVELPRTL
jgi:signal transduction histidine kinase